VCIRDSRRALPAGADDDHPDALSTDGRAAGGRAATRAGRVPAPRRSTDGRAGGGRRRGKPRRKPRYLLWSAGTLAVLLLLGTGVLAWLYHKLDGNVQSADVDDKIGGDRPDDLAPDAETILLIGSDSREGTGGAYGNVDGMNSDTMMVVHIAENREWATVVSLPRDSWVEVPACELGNGEVSEPYFGKLNSAYSTGGMSGDVEYATACAIRTVEHNAGLRMDHFITIDFNGFSGMVDALGGVDMCIEAPIDDPKAHLRLDAGCQSLNGDEALGYVRARYSLGDGSDLSRINRQQEFMQALVAKARSSLTNPTALYDFMGAVTGSLTTDPELAGLQPLLSLTTQLQDIPQDAITFMTVPNYPRELDDPTDRANVVWRYPHAELVFTAMARDERLTEEELERAVAERPTISPADIRVQVLNGSGVPGQAAEAAEALSAAGFQVPFTGNSDLVGGTVIRHPEGLEEHARLLAKRVPGARLESMESETPGVLTLITGPDFAGVNGG
ncbi:LCP family protein, partial [Streptomyces alkaliphilus]|uniref:LCP family protein n=1 Tax=Streptomyces alkaliphilus TaxID=1472722 RepID=UPI002B1F7F79